MPILVYCTPQCAIHLSLIELQRYLLLLQSAVHPLLYMKHCAGVSASQLENLDLSKILCT